MTLSVFPHFAPVNVVLADANVLYSRVLRDYLLYAATRRVITVNWSPEILDDVAEHLAANIPGFTRQRATYLLEKMTETFPDASVEPSANDYSRIADHVLPDGDDREVIAAAFAAEADTICTNNMSHFPEVVMRDLGLVAMTPDDLFCNLFSLKVDVMLEVHHITVRKFQGATDESTIAALRKAQAPCTADLIAGLLNLT